MHSFNIEVWPISLFRLPCLRCSLHITKKVPILSNRLLLRAPVVLNRRMYCSSSSYTSAQTSPDKTRDRPKYTIDVFSMSSCIATSRLVDNDGRIHPKNRYNFSVHLDILSFGGLYLVNKVLLNLDRFYSILTTIQYFKLKKSAIMDQLVTFRKRVYRLSQLFSYWLSVQQCFPMNYRQVPMTVDGDRRLSHWLDFLAAIRKIGRWLKCVNVRSALSQ